MKPSAYTIDYEKLRSWMAKKRGEAGLSLRDAAKTMGRHHSVLGKMEQDRRKIEITEFINYCRSIDADPHEGLDILIKSMDSKN